MITPEPKQEWVRRAPLHGEDRLANRVVVILAAAGYVVYSPLFPGDVPEKNVLRAGLVDWFTTVYSPSAEAMKNQPVEPTPRSRVEVNREIDRLRADVDKLKEPIRVTMKFEDQDLAVPTTQPAPAGQWPATSKVFGRFLCPFCQAWYRPANAVGIAQSEGLTIQVTFWNKYPASNVIMTATRVPDGMVLSSWQHPCSGILPDG